MNTDKSANENHRVEFRSVEGLVPYARNARTHDAANVAQIQASILEFGWTNPILADATGIVAGHGRTLAARALYAAGHSLRFPNGDPIPSGMVPVIDVSGWSDAKRRAYILADNKLALNSSWDMEMLRVELEEIEGAGIDLDLTGFVAGEIDVMMSDLSESERAAGEPAAKAGGEAGGEEPYSRKIEAPIYTPSGEKPAPADLYDGAKTAALLAEIAAADLPDDVAAFLRSAAERHTVFNFARVADFYAHADAATQRLMENSALVIVDFNRAIENGFVKLTKRLGKLAEGAAAAPEAEDAERLDEAA